MPSKWWYYIVGQVAVSDCVEYGDPKCLSFVHRVVFADGEAAAVREGQRQLGFHQEKGIVRNDYVLPAFITPPQEHGA